MIEGVKKIAHKAEEASVVVEVIPGGKGEAGQKFDKQGSSLRTLRSGIAMDIGLPAEDHAEDVAVKEAADKLKTRYVYRFLKRLFDISFSALVLIVFSWLFFVVALAIKIDDPKGSIIFKQKRVTKDGKEFDMYKFRSMCVDAEEHLSELKELNEKTGPVFKMHNDPRITRVGKVIRKLSMASVIIGTPGDGESTKSLSRSANSSLELQICERRPGICSSNSSHYKPFKFLSSLLLGGTWSSFNCVFNHVFSHAFVKLFQGFRKECSFSFALILKAVSRNG